MPEDEEFDNGNIEETGHYVRFGKGKNAILVGKNQFKELLDQGLTVHQALMALAEKNAIGWVKGGPICEVMMTNQYIYLRNLGVPHDDIIKHFEKEFPTEMKCLIGEAVSDEEIKANIKELIMRFTRKASETVKDKGDDEDEQESSEEAEPPTARRTEPQEKPEMMLGDQPVETEEDLELYVQEKEGWCCGTNPKVLSIFGAVEVLQSQEIREALMKDYVMKHWTEPQLFEEACKHCNRTQLISEAFNNIVESKLKDIVDAIVGIDGEDKAKELYGKYLSGEIKSLFVYFDKNYSSDSSEPESE